MTAPGEVALVVSTPSTTDPCGPFAGFDLAGVRFAANAEPLGEGIVVARHANGDPARYRYVWAVEPGEDGVPESGPARFVISAELLTEGGIDASQSLYPNKLALGASFSDTGEAEFH